MENKEEEEFRLGEERKRDARGQRDRDRGSRKIEHTE